MDVHANDGNDGVVPLPVPVVDRRRGPLRWLTPIPADRRVRRFSQLIVGLLLYGFTMGLMVRAVLGLDPWDVFHQGVAQHVPISFGAVTAVTGVMVLLAWIPLRQRPGLGTDPARQKVGPRHLPLRRADPARPAAQGSRTARARGDQRAERLILPRFRLRG